MGVNATVYVVVVSVLTIFTGNFAEGIANRGVCAPEIATFCFISRFSLGTRDSPSVLSQRRVTVNILDNKKKEKSFG